jgi:hypothetical protein
LGRAERVNLYPTGNLICLAAGVCSSDAVARMDILPVSHSGEST